MSGLYIISFHTCYTFFDNKFLKNCTFIHCFDSFCFTKIFISLITVSRSFSVSMFELSSCRIWENILDIFSATFVGCLNGQGQSSTGECSLFSFLRLLRGLFSANTWMLVCHRLRIISIERSIVGFSGFSRYNSKLRSIGKIFNFHSRHAAFLPKFGSWALAEKVNR